MSPDPSKPVPLEAEVIDAVAKAIALERGDLQRPEAWDRLGQLSPVWQRWRDKLKAQAQAAILAADEARGMRVEHADRLPAEPIKHYRLVSRWFPIKGPVDE